MLRDIAAFEWRYHTRQWSFVVAVAMYALAGFALTATQFGPANVHINSPYSVAESLGLAALASIFAIAVFCANAVVRDREYRMEEIVFSTPATKLDFLGGRFAGSFLAAFTAFAAAVPGMMAALLLPSHDASRIGAVSIVPYAWALLVIVLPGMLFAAVLLFGIAALTRSVIGSVVGAVGLYAFYFVSAAMTNSPLMAGSAQGAEQGRLAILLDPFGLAAFFAQTRYWPAAVRNRDLVRLSGLFLANRLLWIAAAAVLFAAIYKSFSFAPRGRAVLRGELVPRVPRTASVPRFLGEPTEEPRGTEEPRNPEVPGARWRPVAPVLSSWRALAALVRLEVRAAIAGRPFVALTFVWLAFAVSTMFQEVAGGEYGAAYYATPALLLASVRQVLAIVASIVLIYYSGEIVWRERATRAADIVNATPAPNVVFVLAKWAALASLMLVLTASAVIASGVVQLARSYPSFEPAVIVAFAWFYLLPLVLQSAVALFLQTVARNRFVGMFLVLALVVVVQFGAGFGLSHPLLRFSPAAPFEYSAMNGFDGAGSAFHWLALFWTAIAVAVVALTAAIWRGAQSVEGRGRSDWTRGLRAALGGGAIVAALSGAWIFYNTNILNDYRTNAASLDQRAEYERTYRSYAAMPQPKLGALAVDVDFEPEKNAFHARGVETLTNATTAPQRTLLVTLPREVDGVSVSVDGAALSRDDRRRGVMLFTFGTPIAPGGRAALRFDVRLARHGFGAGPPDVRTAANGAYVDESVFPAIGYQPRFEIGDAIERKKRGLPPIDSAYEGDIDPTAGWIDFDATVSTGANQTAVAPGTLQREWESGGRRFFRYRSDGPMRYAVVFASGRWDVERRRVGDVEVAVFHHPAHRANVERVLDAAALSLRTFSRDFGRYNGSQLRIVEVPQSLDFGGFATPGAVFMNEERLFMIDARDPSRLDLVTRRTAHEVAHQWWGHAVAPAPRPGSLLIVESLAKYGELTMLEQLHGPDAVRRSLEFEIDRYLAGRTTDVRGERPLASLRSGAYLYYGKGAIVLHAIDRLIGAQALREALGRFAAATRGPAGKPTAEGLIEAIESRATPDQRQLIDEWMRDIVFDDLRIDRATAVRRADGRFDVDIVVMAGKRRVVADGASVPLPFDETIGVALTDARGEVWSQAVRLHSGANALRVTVSRLPLFADVDPDLTRIDANRFDNERRVELIR